MKGFNKNLSFPKDVLQKETNGHKYIYIIQIVSVAYNKKQNSSEI